MHVGLCLPKMESATNNNKNLRGFKGVLGIANFDEMSSGIVINPKVLVKTVLGSVQLCIEVGLV